MANEMTGITFWKHTGYTGDVTKKCALTGDDLDRNFFNLKSEDIKDVKLSGDTLLVDTWRKEKTFSIDLSKYSPDMSDYFTSGETLSAITKALEIYYTSAETLSALTIVYNAVEDDLEDYKSAITQTVNEQPLIDEIIKAFKKGHLFESEDLGFKNEAQFVWTPEDGETVDSYYVYLNGSRYLLPNSEAYYISKTIAESTFDNEELYACYFNELVKNEWLSEKAIEKNYWGYWQPYKCGPLYNRFEIDQKIKILNDCPFIPGRGLNSAILKNENNRAISEASVAMGSNNFAGLKGYYWNYVNFTDKAIYLSKENTPLLDSEPEVDTSFENPYSVGDTYSMGSLTQFYDCGVITAINHNKITVDNIPEGVVEVDDRNRYYFYILSKPKIGIADVGTNAFVEGYDNKSLNYGSHAEGCENISYGRYSHTEGSQNKASYAAHAEGYQNEASGYYSHSEGYLTKATAKDSHAEGYKSEATEYHAHAEGNGTKATNIAAHSEGTTTNATNDSAHAEGKSTTASGVATHAEGQNTVAGGMIAHAEGLRSKANGDASHAEGRDTVANGERSHVEGDGTVTNNVAEHAEGQFNNSHKSSNAYGSAGNTQHSIGIGSSSSKKNAFEVMQNGDIYMTGVGGYVGDENSSVLQNRQTVQEVLSAKTSDIEALTKRVKELEINLTALQNLIYDANFIRPTENEIKVTRNNDKTFTIGFPDNMILFPYEPYNN